MSVNLQKLIYRPNTMIRVQDFFKDYNAVKTPYEVDESFVKGVIQASKAHVRASGNGIYIFDYSKRKVVYVSPNIATWCNLQPQHNHTTDYNWYLKNISEKDLQMLIEINQKAFEFWQGMSDDEWTDYVLSYDFMFGEAMVNQRYTPILVKDGNIILAMCEVSPSQSKASGNIIMRRADSKYEYVYSVEHQKWQKVAQQCLTPKEKEIIRSTIKGLSSAAIAEINGKSENTIKTQKRNLCRKLGVSSMPEAITVAMNNGLL